MTAAGCLLSLFCLAQGGTPIRVSLDAADSGKLFAGAGAISASSSRLLYDYPEPERSQVLDYLFKPHYGLNIQILKVEIGSDMNSTDLAEPSHERREGEIHPDLGFEWWLMTEAKRRNPDIQLYALAWGAPGWVGTTFWTQKTIDYLLRWLDIAADKGFVIDYIGGWNERGFDEQWYIDFSRAVKRRFPHIRIVAADDVAHPWKIATAMTQNRALYDAIDIVGAHSPCGWRSDYSTAHSSDDARALNKPLWNSEHSSMTHDFGAMPMARAINRLYIEADVVGYMVWSIVSSWYSTLPIADTGLVLAEWPWSGYYQVDKSAWVYAHTTQFAQPGWQYMDKGCGLLPDKVGSYVSYKSIDRRHFATVVETCDARQPVTMTFTTSPTLRDGTYYVWATNLRSTDPREYFVRTKSFRPDADGNYTLTFQPGYIYTVTNTTGQTKGTAAPRSRVDDMMALPYTDDFDSYGREKLARYFCDLNGGFETYPAAAGRSSYTYRQMVEQKPVSWTNEILDPSTVMGDPRWWGDYVVEADVLLEEPGYVELIGRIAAQQGDAIAGYHLQLSDDGQWRLYRRELNQFSKEEKLLTKGRVKCGLDQWHRLGLSMKGNRLTVLYDGRTVGSTTDDYYIGGQVGFATSKWIHAQFDNFSVKKTGTWPTFVSVADMTATATSQHTKFWKGYSYLACNAVDGKPETTWMTAWGPKVGLPQSLIVDLGQVRPVSGIVYQPRKDAWNIYNNTHAFLTRCNLYVSRDGKRFTRVASGHWPAGIQWNQVRWKSVEARYLELEATEGTNDEASIGELSVITN
jgi:O-glycosyl hydrolase